MIKQIPQRLQSWWYTTMVPEHAPALTIADREQVRKRRLFSVIVLFHIMISVPWLLVKANFLQLSMLVVTLCIFILSLFINRRGYLKTASLCYLISALALIAITVVNFAFIFQATNLVVWSLSLPLLVVAGLLLSSWGPLLIMCLQMLFMLWYVLIGSRATVPQLLSHIEDRAGFMVFSSMVIILVGLFSAISSMITKKAVIKADRTDELELAHQTISQAYITIQKQALTDGLTNLPNHRALVEQLAKEMERARRHERSFSLLFFDADRFKHINDTYGHAAGDIVLRQIGERAGGILRKEDTLGRFGGEEFVLLLPEAGSDEAEEIAERIRLAISASPIALPEVPEVPEGITMTVSIGLATYPLDGDEGEILLTAADEAMYIAKRMGRNQVRTAEEARRMSMDVEIMALLQEEQKKDDAQRAGSTPEQLRETYTLKIISSLTDVLERRDESMSGHAYGVSDLATAIAQQMKLNSKQMSCIGMAALLHDIGKVALPDTLLQKAGTLSSYEQNLLKEHAELGAQILETSPFLSDLIPAVHYHHERWDGSGYPEHLVGEAIPLAARIIAVAEAYDAMQRDYPYRSRRSAEEALSEIQYCASSQFDPMVVEALLKIVAERQLLESVPQSLR